jgi:hypothetical protein
MKKIGCVTFLCFYFFISGCIEKPDYPIPAWVTENSDGRWHAGESKKFNERRFDSNTFVYMGVQQQEKYIFLFAWCDERRRFHSELHLFNAAISTNPTILKDRGTWVHASDANIYLGGSSATTLLLVRVLDDVSIFRISDPEERYLRSKDSILKIKFSDQSSLALTFGDAYALLGNSCLSDGP